MTLKINLLKGVAIPTSLLGLTLLLQFSSVNSVNENALCPSILKHLTCERIQCVPGITKDQCPEGTIYNANFALCGCCPSCVEYIPIEDVGHTVPCVENDSPDVVWTPNCLDDNDKVCSVIVNTCLPGLICNATSACELPENPLDRGTEECMYRKSLKLKLKNLVPWDADCEPDGSFSPKQCKGSLHDGECYCVDNEGKRIFGREWRNKAENQTCACSRMVHELREKQGLTATFHCSPDGNYEPLQCDTDSGLCYCVDPQTGNLDGAVLPESQWKSLPCFSLNLTNNFTDGKYLRKCESEFAGLRQLSIIGNEHGVTMKLKNLLCDYDGSYAPVQFVSTTTQCVFKNGTKIKDYSKPSDLDMTCNCGRDKFEYLPSEKKSFDFDCEQRSGNFEIVYDFGSESSCMDQDGFLYGDVAKSKFVCCLKAGEGCSEETLKGCYSEINPTGYKPCGYWPFRY